MVGSTSTYQDIGNQYLLDGELQRKKLKVIGIVQMP